jgi:predicted MFS family arabinose efflux permease
MKAIDILCESIKRIHINQKQERNKDDANAVSIFKLIVIYSFVSFFLFFEMAIQVTPSVMSTELMNDLNISSLGLGILSGIYFYTYTAMQLPSGFLFDRFNPRIIITLSILTCSIGVMLFSFADNIYLGSLARLIMGCGSAFAFVSVLVVSADLFKPKHFAVMAGVTQMLAAFGAMAGQMPIEIFIAAVGWRETMLLLSAVGFALAAIVFCLVNYKKTQSNLIKSNSSIQRDFKKILKEPQTWYIALYSCLLWAPMSGFASLWGVPFLTNVSHFSQNDSALLCSLMWLGLAVASPLIGIISNASKSRVMPLVIAAAIGAISFTLILKFNLSKTIVGILLFFAGVACSGQALSFALVKENNQSSITATAIAFNNMAIVISGAIFQPLIGKVISSHQLSNHTVENFKYGLSILICSYVVAFVIASVFINETRHPACKLAKNDYDYAGEI